MTRGLLIALQVIFVSATAHVADAQVRSNGRESRVIEATQATEAKPWGSISETAPWIANPENRGALGMGGGSPWSDIVTGSVPKPSEAEKLAGRYCESVSDKAADARFALQMKEMQAMEAQLKQKISELGVAAENYKTWLERRNVFVAKVNDSLVQIYNRMQPEAAAKQFTVMDDVTAAAIMSRLEPQVSSVILGEMASERAARLLSVMTDAAMSDVKAPRKASAP